MKKIILSCLLLASVTLGATYAYAYCNPFVQRCGPFRQAEGQPLDGGREAGLAGCGWLGCGW